MDKNEVRKLKRRTIMNAYGDRTLADRYKDLSADRIRAELGLTIPKSLPKVKTFTPEEKIRKQRYLENVRYALDQGIDPDNAYRLKQYRKTRIQTSAEYLRELQITPTYKKIDYTENGKKKTRRELSNFELDVNNDRFFKEKTKQQRRDIWRKWAHDKTIPPDLLRYARQVNRNTSNSEGTLDDESNFGFVIVWNMFTRGIDYQTALRERTPDTFDEEIVQYKNTTKATRSSIPVRF